MGVVINGGMYNVQYTDTKGLKGHRNDGIFELSTLNPFGMDSHLARGEESDFVGPSASSRFDIFPTTFFRLESLLDAGPTQTRWHPSVYTRAVARSSPIPRNHACIILVRRCSTRGRKVRTLVSGS